MSYQGCKWCGGKGCLQCERESKAAQERAFKNPLITARWDNPEEMAALKRVVGREALEHAFGFDGGGMQEIKYNAAIENIKKLISGGDPQ